MLDYRELPSFVVCVVLSLGFSACAVAGIAFFDFEDAETGAYWSNPIRTSLTRSPAEVIDGTRSLKLDTLESGSEWNELFVTLTNGVPMKGGKRYAISFQYNVVELNGNDSCFYMLARSKSGRGPDTGRAFWTLDPDDPSSDTVRVVLPDGIDNYSFIFGVRRRGAVVVDNIRITQIPDLNLSANCVDRLNADFEPYGMCAHLGRGPSWGTRGFTDEQVTESIIRLAHAGIQWLRTGVGWQFVETRKNSYNATRLARLDLIVNTAESVGMHCYIQLGGTPQWASERPDRADFWAYGPANLVDWAEFVQFMAVRYKGKVKHWEIHNEPDWTFWKSAFTNYVPFLRTACDTLRTVDSSNQVILGGLATDGVHAWTLDGAEQRALQRLYDAGAKEYFDILGLHAYPSPEHGVVKSVDAIDTACGVMVANGDADKPIWITEIGWSSLDDSVTHLAEQAGVVSNLYAQLVHHPKVDKIFWYNYRCKTNESARENNFGIVQNDLTPRPAFVVLSNLLKTATHKRIFDRCPD